MSERRSGEHRDGIWEHSGKDKKRWMPSVHIYRIFRVGAETPIPGTPIPPSTILGPLRPPTHVLEYVVEHFSCNEGKGKV